VRDRAACAVVGRNVAEVSPVVDVALSWDIHFDVVLQRVDLCLQDEYFSLCNWIPSHSIGDAVKNKRLIL
jgi:hypothetical protein